jgi:glucans biosynthesis protein
MPAIVRAQTLGTAGPSPFSFDLLTEDAARRASQPWVPAPNARWTEQAIDYDLYRRIFYLENRMRWADAPGFRLAAYPTGGLFQRPVRLYEVDGGTATPMLFTAADFEFRHPDMAAAAASMGDTPLPVAGLRISYPINADDRLDELVSFLGASYFRALGRNNVYGLSARGLVINSWMADLPEEFPDFTAFYAERPNSADRLVVYAELDSPSVAGAYRFVIIPGGPNRQPTVMEVEARLFMRTDIAQLGVAPMTSMFLFAEANRTGYDDYRPQVHDSNGLVVRRADGVTAWRALNNPPGPSSSWLREQSPSAFGLEQRGRDFAQYQDAGAHYERRPSLLCEPLEEWGDGYVRLTEAHTKLEIEDNIGAFWVPAEPVRAGDSHTWRYRLSWGDLTPSEDDDIAHVHETRSGAGGVSGGPDAASVRKFVIDFKGGPLRGLDPHRTAVDIFVEASPGLVKYKSAGAVNADGLWRVALDIDFGDARLSELRAYLISGGRQITETWLYQWTRQQ